MSLNRVLRLPATILVVGVAATAAMLVLGINEGTLIFASAGVIAALLVFAVAPLAVLALFAVHAYYNGRRMRYLLAAFFLGLAYLSAVEDVTAHLSQTAAILWIAAGAFVLGSDPAMRWWNRMAVVALAGVVILEAGSLMSESLPATSAMVASVGTRIDDTMSTNTGPPYYGPCPIEETAPTQTAPSRVVGGPDTGLLSNIVRWTGERFIISNEMMAEAYPDGYRLTISLETPWERAHLWPSRKGKYKVHVAFGGGDWYCEEKRQDYPPEELREYLRAEESGMAVWNVKDGKLTTVAQVAHLSLLGSGVDPSIVVTDPDSQVVALHFMHWARPGAFGKGVDLRYQVKGLGGR